MKTQTAKFFTSCGKSKPKRTNAAKFIKLIYSFDDTRTAGVLTVRKVYQTDTFLLQPKPDCFAIGSLCDLSLVKVKYISRKKTLKEHDTNILVI